MKKRFLGIGLPLLACLVLASCGGGSDVLRTTYSSENPISSSEEPREYEITWEDFDGSVLRVDSLAYGDLPDYGADPEREGDAQYSYAFSDWEPSVERVTGDATYKAVYTSSTNQCEITWEDYDGSVLCVDSVPYGETPSYDFGAPERDDYAGPYDCWVFDGWYPEVEAATSDATYTATYSKQACTEFTIRYDANGGTDWVPGSQKKKRGEPLKLDTCNDWCRKEGYALYGWNNLYEGKIYHVGDVLTLDMNLTMYAMWVPICPICGGDGYAEKTACLECEGEGYFCPYCNEPLIYSIDSYEDCTLGYCSSCGEQLYKYGHDAYSSKVYFDEKVMCTNCQGKGYVGFDGECDTVELEAAPILSNIEARSVTLLRKSGYEYSIDGGEYQSSNVFDGLLPHTAYTFRQRRATSGGVPFGVDSKELAVTTTDTSYYYVTYELNGGQNDPRNPTTYYRWDTSTPLYAPSKEGYSFAGWSYNGEAVSEIKGSWNVDITLEATWTPTEYAITYELDGGVNASSNPDCYTIESESLILSDPTRAGYSFAGWYSDSAYSNEVGGIPSGSKGDMVLYAKWTANKNNLFVDSSDESKGCVSVSGAGYSGEEITVTAIPTEGYALKGWYHEGTLASRDNPYSFDMPADHYSLTAEFWTEAEGKAEEERREALGIDPVFDAENKTVTYGLYPQTHVSDTDMATLAALNALTDDDADSSNGWYLLNGEYYAKASASPCGSIYVFDDGTTIVEGTTYWFKCEPIKWKILSSTDDGEYSLVSTVLLDAHRYNKYYSGADESGYYANNYENSEIREWLNDEFYNSAFCLDKSFIQTTTVDNSASTGKSSSNRFVCPNTSDNVYLLSYQDYKNASYFADYEATLCKTTDWARANGARYNFDTSYLYNGYYWTRTPNETKSGYVYARENEFITYACALCSSESHTCVRPAIKIKAAK